MSLKKHYNDRLIGAYTVSKKRNAKRVTLSIAKNGIPNATIPFYAPYKTGQAFVQRQRQWILQHMPEKTSITPGSQFELYDSTSVVVSEGGERNSTKIVHGQIDIRLKDSQQSKYFDKAIIKHLAQDSKNAIEPRIEHYKQRLSVEPAELRFRSTTSRWGSCNSRKQLTFSVYIAQLPNELIDYIVIHELAHIVEMNHSQNFWRLVASQDPNYIEHRKELKGYKLEAYLKKV